MKKFRFLLSSLCLAAGLLFSACDPECDCAPPLADMATTIANNSDLSTFRALLDRTGLNDTLLNRPSITVFAPDNAAWEAYRAISGYFTLADIPVPELRKLLLYHLTAGEVRSTGIQAGYLPSLALYATTSDALKLNFSVANNVWMVNAIPVANGELAATNGLLYPVGQVLALPTLVSQLQVNPDYSTFVQALTRADLGIDYLSTLSENGPYTVFAPLNSAFSMLLNELGYANLEVVPVNTLNAIIQYHIIPNANLTGEDLRNLPQLTTLGGKKITITGGTKLTDNLGRSALLFDADVQTTTGVIHSINAVLRPN